MSIRDSALIRARARARPRGWRRVLFEVLVVVQLLHLGEHSVQMVQLHLLHLPPAEARGLVSPLDVEKVHFVWNVIVLGAIGWLLPVRTAWLGAAVVWAVLHLVAVTGAGAAALGRAARPPFVRA